MSAISIVDPLRRIKTYYIVEKGEHHNIRHLLEHPDPLSIESVPLDQRFTEFMQQHEAEPTECFDTNDFTSLLKFNGVPMRYSLSLRDVNFHVDGILNPCPPDNLFPTLHQGKFKARISGTSFRVLQTIVGGDEGMYHLLTSSATFDSTGPDPLLTVHSQSAGCGRYNGNRFSLSDQDLLSVFNATDFSYFHPYNNEVREVLVRAALGPDPTPKTSTMHAHIGGSADDMYSWKLKVGLV